MKHELYLVAYSYVANIPSNTKGIKSISFGESFTDYHSLEEIIKGIEKQTGDRVVNVLAITELHKIINYVGDKTEENSPDFISASH